VVFVVVKSVEGASVRAAALRFFDEEEEEEDFLSPLKDSGLIGMAFGARRKFGWYFCFRSGFCLWGFATEIGVRRVESTLTRPNVES
jgi:hypothetical protein